MTETFTDFPLYNPLDQKNISESNSFLYKFFKIHNGQAISHKDVDKILDSVITHPAILSQFFSPDPRVLSNRHLQTRKHLAETNYHEKDISATELASEVEKIESELEKYLTQNNQGPSEFLKKLVRSIPQKKRTTIKEISDQMASIDPKNTSNKQQKDTKKIQDKISSEMSTILLVPKISFEIHKQAIANILSEKRGQNNPSHYNEQDISEMERISSNLNVLFSEKIPYFLPQTKPHTPTNTALEVVYYKTSDNEISKDQEGQLSLSPLVAGEYQVKRDLSIHDITNMGVRSLLLERLIETIHLKVFEQQLKKFFADNKYAETQRELLRTDPISDLMGIDAMLYVTPKDKDPFYIPIDFKIKQVYEKDATSQEEQKKNSGTYIPTPAEIYLQLYKTQNVSGKELVLDFAKEKEAWAHGQSRNVLLHNPSPSLIYPVINKVLQKIAHGETVTDEDFEMTPGKEGNQQPGDSSVMQQLEMQLSSSGQ